ncbi:hypothetical protein [Loktanella sp. Alg231-35]|uniref:hypothetical protein n=1 Tax=Loktanella sp. Alg231-35 TaxID=1922220 RepID=UPI0018FFD563|nr:hypothetical protein [Loktanella sp. Alg231-35]
MPELHMGDILALLLNGPNPDNARAIAVYKELGFVPAGPPQNTQWALILPMITKA